jgi:hypothetical protein
MLDSHSPGHTARATIPTAGAVKHFYGVTAFDTCTGGIQVAAVCPGAAERTSGPVLELSTAGVPNALCPMGRIAARAVYVLSSIHAAMKVPAGVATRLGLVA